MCIKTLNVFSKKLSTETYRNLKNIKVLYSHILFRLNFFKEINNLDIRKK